MKKISHLARSYCYRTDCLVFTMSRLRCLQKEVAGRLRAGGGLGPLAANNLVALPAPMTGSSRRQAHSERPRFKYHPDRDLHPPEPFEITQMPERHRLPIMPKTPSMWSSGAMKPPKQTKVGGVYYSSVYILFCYQKASTCRKGLNLRLFISGLSLKHPRLGL